MKKSVVLLAIVLTLASAAAIPVLAATDRQAFHVTRGQFQAYADGSDRGYDVPGQAIMIREVPRSKMVVISHVRGLVASTSYASRVHDRPCNVNSGGGHYQNVVGGPVDSINEIWLGFTTNAAGIGIGNARNDFVASPGAQSVVIHDTDGACIACADLE